MKKLFVILLVGIIYAVPPYISYQGVLHDDQGQPINGTVEIMFSLYDETTGGTALWSETQSVLISDGLFNIKLGAVTALPNFVFNTEALFLGIKVGADSEMTPRQILTTMAYSFRSQMSVPIGTMMAWNKSMPNMPVLPEGWVECNGQTLSDPESPFDGQVIPNLNNGKLIIGNSSSGETSASHSHAFTTGDQIVTQSNFIAHWTIALSKKVPAMLT
jgi:hypothetical protein